jgi:CheY-like chemotaxis protein
VKQMNENRHTVVTGFEPLQTGSAEASWIEPNLKANPAEVRGKRILVVDDEAAVRECLRMMLEMEGYQVTEAGDGAEALTSFAIDHFDLVITDFEMPMMKGNELAVNIKQLAPSVPIVMITASPKARRGAENPVDALVSKPFVVQDLYCALRKLFAARPGAAQLAAVSALERI